MNEILLIVVVLVIGGTIGLLINLGFFSLLSRLNGPPAEVVEAKREANRKAEQAKQTQACARLGHLPDPAPDSGEFVWGHGIRHTCPRCGFAVVRGLTPRDEANRIAYQETGKVETPPFTIPTNSPICTKLRVILERERDLGYEDRLIIGGIEAFAQNWVKATAREYPQYLTDLQSIADMLRGYSDASTQLRESHIKCALALVNGEPLPGFDREAFRKNVQELAAALEKREQEKKKREQEQEQGILLPPWSDHYQGG